MAARADRHGAAGEPGAVEVFRLRAGHRRGPLDGADRRRAGGPRRCADLGAVHALPLAHGAHLRRKGAVGDAPQVRRTPRAPDRRLTVLPPLSPASGERGERSGTETETTWPWRTRFPEE